MQFKNPKAFTILEILVVIAIIGVLAAVVMVNGLKGRSQSKDVRRIDNMSEIHKALKLYYIDNAKYPTTPGSTGECLGIADNGGIAGRDLDTVLRFYMYPMPKDPKQTNFALARTCGDNPSPTRQYYYFYADSQTCRLDSNGNNIDSATLHIQTLETTTYNNNTTVCPTFNNIVPTNNGQFRSSQYRIVLEEKGS